MIAFIWLYNYVPCCLFGCKGKDDLIVDLVVAMQCGPSYSQG